MTTIKRRSVVPVPSGSSEVLLRFTDGKVVDPKRCPKGSSAHPHWRLDGAEHPPGEVNTVCACAGLEVDG